MDIPGVFYLVEEAALTLAGYINAEVCGYISVGRDATRCAQGLLASMFPSPSHWKPEIQVEFSPYSDVPFCSSLQLEPTRGREIAGIRCAVSQGFPGVVQNRAPQARGRGKTTGNGLRISLIYEGLPTVEGEKKTLDCSIKTLHKELL